MKQFNKKAMGMADNFSGYKELTMEVFSESELPFSIITFQTEDDTDNNIFEYEDFTGCGKIPTPQAIMIDVTSSAWNGFHLLKSIHADDDSPHIPVFLLSSEKTDR